MACERASGAVTTKKEVKMQDNTNRSIGFSTYEYNQVILFSNENDFKEIVAANSNMTAIIGADDYTRKNFPGVYVAGVMANSPRGIAEDDPAATRK